MKLDAQTVEFLRHLWRGGDYAYYWRSAFKTSTWFSTGATINPPADSNVYFGLHPTNTKRDRDERSTNATIAAINCLFAEFDAKDFASLGAALGHVNHLRIPPSVLVCSGGGYHAYWLLAETEVVTDDNREELRQLQHRWVELMGGDPGAKDLARVLRVPGSLNAKYDPPRRVEFVWFDPDYFVLDCLRTHVETFGPKTKPRPAPAAPAMFGHLPDGASPERARAYGQAALSDELFDLLGARKGQRNRRLNVAAFKLAGLVAGGMLDQNEAVEGLYYTAVSLGTDESFTDKNIRDTINSGFTSGLKHPRELPND